MFKKKKKFLRWASRALALSLLLPPLSPPNSKKIWVRVFPVSLPTIPQISRQIPPIRASLSPPGGGVNGVAMDTSGPLLRIGEVKRVTKETNVHVKINLDGTGIADCKTGIPFLDHMLDQLSSHGLFDLHVEASGDTHIDDHHTNEDIALAIGTALLQALGDRKGIHRFGHFVAPLDEACVDVVLDLSGRPHLTCELSIPTKELGCMIHSWWSIFSSLWLTPRA
ncbi:putative imidazoleglycerol-phosphate dehydratase [Iris pallida]|uniref:imidazoleglycerol-phosphate dehydratase n=1 Tax=Iris pallida TaxID=29817 RepID=A0AAX6EDT1_IRIPA|nr:putative imidazoleglycerol-phosphate dehydratase [Iris pallida]